MNILYIYREYGGRRKRYGKVMSRLGHKVRYITLRDKTTPGQIDVPDLRKHPSDLVFLLSPFYVARQCISQAALEYLKEHRIPMVTYSTFDTQTPYTEWLDVWRHFDVLFMQQRDFCDWLQAQGVAAHYVPLAFHPEQYYRCVRRKRFDVSFMGSAQSQVADVEADQRVIYLRALKGFDLHVYGKNFRGRLDGVDIHDFSTHRQQRRVYAQTRLNLDLPFVNSSHPFYQDQVHVKNRLFEVPATGNFLLEMQHPEFLEMFGEDLVGYYEPSIEAFVEAVRRYLADETLRRTMAEKAHRHAHQKHTFRHRFEEIFRILDQY